MASDVGASHEAVKVNKRVKDRQIQNLPDYLRFVARKSKAGFDKVHEELTKIYSTEKKLQRQKTSTDNEVPRAFPSRDTKARTTTIDLRSTSKPLQQTGNRHSLRNQWTRSIKANTMWMSTGSYIPEEGTFISYIDEDIESNSEQSRRKISVEQLKQELKPRSQSAEEGPSTAVQKLESNFKSLSANQVRKDKLVFTFDTLRASRSFETLLDPGEEQCHDYVNIGDYRHQQHTTGTNNEQSENDYDVPKASLKSPAKSRKEVKAKLQTRNNVNYKPETIPSACGKPADRFYVNDSNHETNGTISDDDYLQMDDVITLVSGKNELAKEQLIIEEHRVGMPSTCLGDSGDYVLSDTCISTHAFEKESLYTQLKHNKGDEDDYLPMDEVKSPVSGEDKLAKEQLARGEHSSDMYSDDMGDASDYVLPDICKPNCAFGKQSPYTQLKQNQGGNVYATVKKTREGNDKETEENIYANSTSALYDDFDNLTENDVLPYDSERVYDILPSHAKHVYQTNNNATKSKHSSDDSITQAKDFYEFTLPEVVECLNACALPRLASICEDEHLDGQFFVNFDESVLIKEPFSLNWFHIAKLRRVISGWRPKQ